MITLHANKSYVKRLDGEIITSGRVGDLELQCTFDDDWTTPNNFAVFTVPGLEYAVEVPLVNGKCVVPPEATAKAGPIIIGIYGKEYNNGELHRKHSPIPIKATVRQGSAVEATESSLITINDWFAKQTANAQAAAQAAVKAAKIANGILQEIKNIGGKTE